MTIHRDVFFEDDKMIFHAVQTDADYILDRNKHDNNHAPNVSASGDLKHVARIPLIIAEFWLFEYGVDVLNQDHQPAVRKLLNDPDWMYLRTGGGVL